MPRRRSPRHWRFSSLPWLSTWPSAGWAWANGSAGAHRSLIWLGCGFSVGAAILLRPDGGILLAAIGGIFAVAAGAQPADRRNASALLEPNQFWAGVLVAARSRSPPSFPGPCAICTHCTASSRWLRAMPPTPTNWSCTASIAGSRPGSRITFRCRKFTGTSPARTSTSRECPAGPSIPSSSGEQTAELFADYNRDHDMTAGTRRPLRSPGGRAYSRRPPPLLRLASGSAHRGYVAASANRAVSLGPALVGVQRRPPLACGQPGVRADEPVLCGSGGGWSWLRAREFFGIGLLVLFLLLRSVFLGTLENPEPRYTLECYPIVIFLGSAVFFRKPGLTASSKM